jgi:hypothetical protein
MLLTMSTDRSFSVDLAGLRYAVEAIGTDHIAEQAQHEANSSRDEAN